MGMSLRDRVRPKFCQHSHGFVGDPFDYHFYAWSMRPLSTIDLLSVTVGRVKWLSTLTKWDRTPKLIVEADFEIRCQYADSAVRHHHNLVL